MRTARSMLTALLTAVVGLTMASCGAADSPSGQPTTAIS